jgi:formylglycine-generating enzyme required for sulfatase activity
MRLALRALPVFVLAALTAGLAFPRPQAEPRQYALLVGVNAYDNARFPALRFAVNDAAKFAALLKKHGYSVQLLTDETQRKPTRANIEAALGDLFGKYNRELKRTEPGKFAPGDSVLIGLAGHGVQYGPSAYFCPRDALLGLDQTGSLVALDRIYEALDNAPRGVKFLLVDACRNDATRGIRGGDPTAVLQPPTGVGVLLSCSAKEVAYEHESLDQGHGVFFYHVLKGLEGAARDGDEPVVTWDSLRSYVKKSVPRKVAELYGGDPGHQQHPNEMGNLSGIPPVLVKLQGGSGDSKVREVDYTYPWKGQTRYRRLLILDLGGGEKLELVRIPKGSFQMGSPDSDKDASGAERPQHEVELTQDFYLGKTEVTVGQFRRFVTTSGYRTEAETGDGAHGWDEEKGEWPKHKSFTWRYPGFKQDENHPVVCVSYWDAEQFCAWVEKQTGVKVGLPTEAQWEYACRGGTTTRYFTGNDPESLKGYANVADAALKRRYPHLSWTMVAFNDGEVFTAPVRSYNPNPFGLYDMIGNAYEWCADWYSGKAYTANKRSDPAGPSGGSSRVCRGGSWHSETPYCRASYRVGGEPAYRDAFLGLRVCRAPVR